VLLYDALESPHSMLFDLDGRCPVAQYTEFEMMALEPGHGHKVDQQVLKLTAVTFGLESKFKISDPKPRSRGKLEFMFSEQPVTLHSLWCIGGYSKGRDQGWSGQI
jgi:hypothetical protein